MGWNYSGRPDSNDRDKVRFLVGDTDRNCPLVQDEEIAWALSSQSTITVAAAVCCEAIAARYGRLATVRVGDVSKNCGDISKAFRERAKELRDNDSSDLAALALPSFGGLSISQKETLANDTDAVQPSFQKGMDDIPGGPSEFGGLPYNYDHHEE
jgi:hypothetical protein